jgi:tetratricopeptide (TPR) repeat protein
MDSANSVDILERLKSLRKLINESEAEEAWRQLEAFCVPNDAGAAARLRQTKGMCASRIAGLASQRGDYDEAVVWGRRAVDCDPQSAWARVALANALSNAGEAAEAWAILTELRDRGAPADIAGHIRKAMGFSATKLAQAAKARQANDLALAWRERAVELVPESSQYSLALGWAFFAARRFYEAWDILARLEELARDDPSVADGTRKGLAACATALAKEVEFDKGPKSVEGTGWREAARWREESLRRNPGLAVDWWRYAWDLVYCGRFADAAAIVAGTHSPEIDAKLRYNVGDMPRHLKAQIDSGESIFRCEAPRYRMRGLPVVPALGKVVIPADWDVWSDRLPDEATYQRWNDIPGANIGLVLGRQSGVSVIDIDTEDADLTQVICALLPPSPWQRFGRRGVALAYRWTGVPTQNFWDWKSMAPLFDLLSGPSHVLLPPSVHPQTGRPYRAERDLLDVLDDLPALPDDFVETATAALRARGCDVRTWKPRWLERKAALLVTP